VGDELERGREAYARRRWAEAHESLLRVDGQGSLAAEDLELLATAAYMLGRDGEQQSALERAHQAHLERGDRRRAVQCAFWLGVHLLLRREAARANGWFARAQRLLEQDEGECVEQGYVLVATDLQHSVAAEWEAAYAAAAAAAEIAERFADADLLALALMDQGRHLVRQGRVREGLEKLDEAMVVATAQQLSPIVTGLVYCSVIDGCQELHELGRAGEWTAALTEWCDGQPGLVPFTGTCLIHRAELMQLRGQWPEAFEEARLAAERFAQRSNDAAAGDALYRQGEILRLQGNLAAAEEAYRAASRSGREPQPGLAQLRHAQGRTGAATAAIEQALAATTNWVERARLLPAAVEIVLAAGDRERAQALTGELDEIATRYGSSFLRAHVAQARGAVALADGDARGALLALRRAWKLWQELEAPYEGARARLLAADACRAIGDEETAALELDAARATLERLGAARPEGGSGDLTVRELQVLRLLAAGRSNKAIAAELVLSKRTVDRHVSNIFAKCRVSSRAAATAYAYEHDLI
jgi:DNA-binding CsgD family transcriptional regulator/3-hydroxyisobutyrate dehydrogenase-like beta-hydroxyacid dehydrogenase